LSSDQSYPSNINRPYVGVGVLVWKGDTLLLGKRINSHAEAAWQFPGGHLEVGETVTKCAVREVREETGIEIAGMKHAGFTDELFSTADRQYVTIFVSAAYVSGEARVLEPEKCQCWQWFHCDELPAPLFKPITDLLKRTPVLNVLRVDLGTLKGAHK
jgi:8-oxo-dGTP diphosphatase